MLKSSNNDKNTQSKCKKRIGNLEYFYVARQNEIPVFASLFIICCKLCCILFFAWSPVRKLAIFPVFGNSYSMICLI